MALTVKKKKKLRLIAQKQNKKILKSHVPKCTKTKKIHGVFI
jgi:hypothetical protein